MNDDPFDLARFLEAQSRCYDRVLGELEAGEKVSHWMWFIFPQLRGLGASDTAQHFGLTGLAEARAYLAHPVLGNRLRECTQILLTIEGRSAFDIFDSPDDLKLRSCLTLFAAAADPPAAAQNRGFAAVLAKYYRGEPDPRTLELLATSSAS